MNTCSTCKYWRKIRDKDYKINEEITWRGPHGECILIDQYSTHKAAWIDAFPVFLEEEVRDIVGLRAKKDTLENELESEGSLITMEDFGCNLWKEGPFKYLNQMTEEEIKEFWKEHGFE